MNEEKMARSDQVGQATKSAQVAQSARTAQAGQSTQTARTARPPRRDDPFVRAPNEDDDGYDPYSDRPYEAPLFEPDPWD